MTKKWENSALNDSKEEASNSIWILSVVSVTLRFIEIFHITVKTNIQTNYRIRLVSRSTYLLNIVNLGVNRFNMTETRC